MSCCFDDMWHTVQVLCLNSVSVVATVSTMQSRMTVEMTHQCLCCIKFGMKLQLHPQCSFLNLRQCVKRPTILVHTSGSSTVASLTYSQTAHHKTHLTWPFNVHETVHTAHVHSSNVFPFCYLVCGISKRLFYFDVCLQLIAPRNCGITPVW